MSLERKGYYAITNTEIDYTLNSKFPNLEPDENGLQNGNLPAYIKWMINRVAEMDRTTMESALKAARWQGWILHAVEADLELWDNQKSRDLTREDVRSGNDKPQN